MLLVEFYNFFSIVWVLSLLLWSLNNWIIDWPTQRTTWKLGLYASIQLLQQWAGDCHYFTLNISSFLGPELIEHLKHWTFECHLFPAESWAQWTLECNFSLLGPELNGFTSSPPGSTISSPTHQICRKLGQPSLCQKPSPCQKPLPKCQKPIQVCCCLLLPLLIKPFKAFAALLPF